MRVRVINEVPKDIDFLHWKLCFQWCEYLYEGEKSEFGYRFIWKDEINHLKPQRGQARIPTIVEMQNVLKEAEEDGWLGKCETKA